MDDSIEIEPTPCAKDRGNDLPVLNEILHALNELLTHDRQTVIDIKSLPFGPVDEERLSIALGQGEVAATIHTLGESRVTETAYAGIWWVEHRNEQGAVIAKFIEVTYMPDILKAQHEDVIVARQKLKDALETIKLNGA
ncbi:MAG: hydrogenase expression/formation C-terminal domain-containing protein [Arenicellales bacterium]|nr:hydrogenase expression/formation C-terminal domain-containing protein [Arenicellales bacterium]